MCGIAAILLHPQERPSADWQAIREILTRNLIFNEERGRAASGLAVVQTDGQVSLLKTPVPASEFVESALYLDLLEEIGPQTTLLLGHTRLPTKGDPAWNANNHPIQAGPVFGVHNGQIANDDDLFARFDLPRSAQVDSEIIFRLIEPANPATLNGNYLETIRPRLQLLQGQFTFLACDCRRPGRLLVLKHQNPLCAHFQPAWNAIIFSSRYVFLRKAFGFSVITEALPHDQLLLYDASRLPQDYSEPLAQLPLALLQSD
ncbi:MAG: hypothetical protein AB1894_00390 [Chloroflexota bacterium]